MSTFVISDTHFDHLNIIRYCNRPFATVGEMNTAIMHNINSIVKEEDVLYHLGDWSYGRGSNVENSIALRQYIRCKHIHLIIGNHDRDNLKSVEFRKCFDSISQCFVGYICGKPFVLTHYPISATSKQDYMVKYIQDFIYYHSKCIYLFGHTHNNTDVTEFNMCVENTNYGPVNIENFLK